MRRYLLTAAAGLLIAALAVAYGDLTSLRHSLGVGRDALSAARTAASNPLLEPGGRAGEWMLDEPCADLTKAASAFSEAVAKLEQLTPSVRLIEQVPGGAANIDTSLTLVSLVTDVSLSGEGLCQGLQPLAALLRESDAREQPLALSEKLLAALVESRPALEQAYVRLARAEAAVARLSPEKLDPDMREAVQALGARLPTIRSGVDGLLVLPELLGANGPRTYLLLAQNRQEMRPAGGYVGAAGVVQVAGGRIEIKEFGTSMAYDLPSDRLVAPPAPMAKYLRASYWQFGNANWWPDFPSSAEQMVYFYNQVRSEPLHGVIAFDQRALELLLEVTGPIAVSEYDETVSKDNLLSLLDTHVHTQIGRVDERQRKAFVGATAAAVLDAIASAPSENLPRYVTALDEALSRKHLLMYLGAPAAAQLATELNWDGHLYRGPGDYVHVVNANLGPNYADPHIQHAARYSVNLTAKRPRANLTLEFTNRVPPAVAADWVTGHYRNYLRVYVPWESELRGATGFAEGVEVTAECGRTVFAGLVDVPLGERLTVELNYDLNPAVLTGDRYSLVVQKQPGMDAMPLSLEVVDHGERAVMEGWLAHDQRYQVGNGTELVAADMPAAETAGMACATPKPEPVVLPAPVRVAIPRLGVQAPISNQKVRPTGEMEVPTEGESVGWYEASAHAGYAGNFVAAAHVDWGGRPAVFWRLHELRPGDEIVVHDAAGGVHTYVVEWNWTARVDNVPVGSVVGPTHDSLITLITCAGNFNPVTRDYSHRQIVRAKLSNGS
jgi:sortase (surface protein transpeptidase)